MNFKTLLLASFFMASGCATATPQQITNPIVMLVKTTVEKEKLVTNPACTDYFFTKGAEPGVDLVEVMEKHGGICPGDVQVQHRLFSVYVDQKTKRMASDKDDLENGTLKILPPAE